MDELDLELREALQSAMISSERFLEALMQEAPLGAPTTSYHYDTVRPIGKDEDRD